MNNILYYRGYQQQISNKNQLQQQQQHQQKLDIHVPEDLFAHENAQTEPFVPLEVDMVIARKENLPIKQPTSLSPSNTSYTSSSGASSYSDSSSGNEDSDG